MSSMVTYESVANAIADLKRDNIRPSVANVRTRLGGGSNTKILAIMNEVSKNSRVEVPPIDESMLKELMRHVDKISAARAAEATTALKAELENAEANQAELLNGSRRLEDLVESLTGRNDALEGEKMNLSAKLEALKDSLALKSAELEKAHDEVRTLREDLLKLRIREGDLEAAMAELAKARMETTEAKEKAAHLKGLLDGRNGAKEDGLETGRAPDIKKTIKTQKTNIKPKK